MVTFGKKVLVVAALALSAALTPNITAAQPAAITVPAKQNIVEVAAAAGQFKTLIAAATAAGLAETLSTGGPFTVFAPSDEAFAKLPAGTVESLLKPENKEKLKAILLYHVVAGKVPAAVATTLKEAKTLNGASFKITVTDGKVKVDNANVLATDVEASNGIIHIIDTVILPPAPAGKDIVDTAVAAGSFKTLAAALTAAGLIETLKGEGPFTVFAPTDAAFAKLPAGTVETLLKPENKEKLKGVLLYHVVAGNVGSADVVKLQAAKTVGGQDVAISVVDGKVKINDATVTVADVKTSNGVIHIVDTVLLPK